MPRRLSIQKLVVHKPTGKLGVTVTDLMNCCSDDETPVVFEGETAFEGTPTNELEVIGSENAVADPMKCGSGRGGECCIFLTHGPRGFVCERFGPMRYELIFKKEKMNAKREPAALFPACQLEE